MGGFFLLLKPSDNGPVQRRSLLQEGFAELGFGDPEVIEADHYVLAVYSSLQGGAPAIKRHQNGDFLFTCGTCLSARGIGLAAAAGLQERQNTPCTASDKIMGHYAAVMRNGGRTIIRLDRFGGYQLFYNREAGIVCSSFYAICLALKSLTLSQQSACEYVFNGVISGNETLFREVSLAPIDATIRVDRGGLEIVRPPLTVTRNFTTEPRDASLRHSIALLDDYFTAVARHCGDRVNCALSGGYDSRLILAYLRRHGMKPRAYVYGAAAEKDVRLAAEIARGEGFHLDIIDKADRPIVPPSVFAETAHRNFLACDGYSYGGIFQNDAEIGESARRVRDNAIAFNGGGGEIFRNFFYLPDREYSIREFLWSFYSRFDPALCTRVFDSNSYYRGLEQKVMDLLGSDEPRLPRPTVEWLYHGFRCRAWDGKVDSVAARYGLTAMPYLERPITEQASALPLAWKNHGAYEAELIRRIDSRLAGHRSIYGHDFSGPPPLSRRIGDYMTYMRPPWLRRYTYRLRHFRPQPAEWPGYLAAPYRDAALPGGVKVLSRLFRVGRIADAAQFARILSLEYALRQFGNRVTVEF